MRNHLTIIVGPPASGKTTLARQMVQENPELVLIENDRPSFDIAFFPKSKMIWTSNTIYLAMLIAHFALEKGFDVAIKQLPE
jgi:predicted kinase